MNEKLGVVEFFTMEAGEYLDRLDTLVSAGAAPDLREFQRLTRALRGAALMANQEAIAGAAGAFEHVAKALKEGRRQWDDATRQLATRAVDDLRGFVRRVREWSPADTQKAHDLTAALEAAVGRPARPSRPAAAGPDSGTRAFVAREGAALASALAQASRALTHNPLARDPLQQVLNVMQPLRGLASLADLPPLPDLLEGIERAVAEVGRDGEPRPLAPQVFEAGARALSEAARAVANDGKADPEAPAVREFASLLDQFLGLDQPVVPIETLYFDDEGPHIVDHGTAPASRERLGDVELVSHGEHLRHVADGLDRATTATQRRLRAQALAGTFRALEQAAGGNDLGGAAAEFARAARDAVAGGMATSDPAALAQHLREASTVLSAAAQGDRERLAHDLRSVTGKLAEAAAAARAPAPHATPEPPAIPRRPLAPSAARVTPPAAPPTPPTAPETRAAPVETAAASDLAGSWLRYEQYVESLGLGPPSLEDLLTGPPAAPASPAAAAPPGAAPAPTADDLVAITELCYSGAAALERARSLRGEIEAALRRGETPTALIEEVLDLVELGLGTQP